MKKLCIPKNSGTQRIRKVTSYWDHQPGAMALSINRQSLGQISERREAHFAMS
jgi:hypothetical protein